LHAGRHHAAAQVHLFCIGWVVTALISAFTLGLCAAAAPLPPLATNPRVGGVYH
jgi:hypothetical protein